jgi:hypothetical protein
MKPIRIFKKLTGSVWFRFISMKPKKLNRTKPKQEKKLSKTGKNQAKPEKPSQTKKTEKNKKKTSFCSKITEPNRN